MDHGTWGTPGSKGLGSWYQSGAFSPVVPGTNLKGNGTYGSYLIGIQRPISFRPKRDHSGLTTMTANLGGEITAFAPFASRPKTTTALACHGPR